MLSSMQLKTLGRRLELRAAQLALRIGAALPHDEDDADAHEMSDREDAADDQARATVDDARLERDLAELREIRLARSRAADERHGRCIACGDEITFERLLAQPTARRCVRCQNEAERDAGKAAGASPRAATRA